MRESRTHSKCHLVSITYQITNNAQKQHTRLYDLALIGNVCNSSHEDVPARYYACFYVLIAPFCSCQGFIFSLTEFLQRKILKEKMNTLHLFLNSAKSSQAGNGKEKEASVCCHRAVFFSCSSAINSQNLWPPSFQSAPPFKPYITLPPFSHSLLWKLCTVAFCQPAF